MNIPHLKVVMLIGGHLSQSRQEQSIYISENKVQVFAIGYGTEIFNDESVKSFEIGKFIGAALGDENFGAQNKNGLK